MSEKQVKVDGEKLPWYYNLYSTIKETPINLTLLIVSAFVCYKVVSITRRRRKEIRLQGGIVESENTRSYEDISPLKRKFTVKELRKYNGTRSDGRILLAVNFNVYDVTGSTHFYGINGTYPQYAGSDISRNLINFSVERNDQEEFDDLSDLTESQCNTLLEWDQQYAQKYPLVGRLVS